VKDALGAVQRVLVLGGGSDIGQAIAARLAAPRRAAIVLAGRSVEAKDLESRTSSDVAVEWFDARATGEHGGVLDDLWARADRSAPDQVTALGTARSELDAAAAVLAVAAAEVDADEVEERSDTDAADRAWARARRVRLAVERASRRVLEASVVAFGASALCHDPAVARRVADLTVYLRQLRPGPELAALAADAPPRRWW